MNSNIVLVALLALAILSIVLAIVKFLITEEKRKKEGSEKKRVWREAENRWRLEEEERRKRTANRERQRKLTELRNNLKEEKSVSIQAELKRKAEIQEKYEREQERLARVKKQLERSLCETGTNYCETVEELFAEDKYSFGFDVIRNISLDFVRNLSDEDKEDLYEQLNHGVSLLNTNEELMYYLFAFGKMHKAKLDEANEELIGSQYLQLDNESVQIIDWGCGQGLGTVVFIDNLRECTGFNVHIDRVILIEPSRATLERASLHVLYSLLSESQNSADIVTINKEIDDVVCENIKADKDKITIHIFSNILDIEEIDLEQLHETISTSQNGKNYFICVSPKFPEHIEYRHERLDDFLHYFEHEDTYELISNRETPIGKHKRFERIFVADFSEKYNPTYSYTSNASAFQNDEPDDLPF